MKILVVEDDDDLRDDLALALRSEGYDVTDCSNGLRAVELASQASFDLIVSDVRMAGIDGLETIERLQKQQPSVATLVITGYAAEADSIRAVRLGVGDYLKKPFRLDEFLQAVERLLSRQRARRLRDQREESWRQLACWSLEAQVPPETVARARQAREAAGELGLTPEVAAQAQALVLLDACGQEPGELGPEFLGQLAEMRREDARQEALSLPARLAQVATGQAPPGEEETALAAAWQRAAQKKKKRPAREGGVHRRGLLFMARSQEQAGQLAEAAQSYRTVAEEGLRDREGVEAWLGLTRLAGPNCQEQARQAVALARELNPLLWGVTCLQAGLHLGQSRELLEQARRIGHELGQRLLEAQATLALAGVSGPADERLEAALSHLLQPEERYELVDAAWWIAPCLLRRQALHPHPAQDKLLAVLGRDTPGVIRRLLPGLEPDARRAAVAALAGSAHPLARETLRGLIADPDAGVRQAAQDCLREEATVATPPLLRLFTLGTFELYRGEERLPDSAFRSWKQRFLLARLAGSPRPLAPERLIEEFWPEDVQGGKASLNTGISHLRKALRPPAWPEELDYVLRDPAGVQLNPALPFWDDCGELLQHLDEGPMTEERLGRWKRGLQLYRGPFLDQCYVEWAVQLRQRVDGLVLEAARRVLEVCTKPAEILEYATRLVQVDPCSQEGNLAVMRANLDLGRPEAVVERYQECLRRMTEAGLEPSIAILEAHQRARLML